MKQLEKIKAAIKRKSADALLVTQPENRRYLSGYTATDLSIAESSGVLLISGRGTPLLLTDSRYSLQAEKEATGFEVVSVRSSLLGALKKMLPQLGIRRLLFESHYLLHATAVKLIDMGQKQNIGMIPTSGMVEKLRKVKSADEIEKIRQAVGLNELVFQEIYQNLIPGQTEREVAIAIESAMMRKGAEEPAFPTIVATGPNAAVPHAVPSERAIKEGETVIIDMGLKLNGYCSDMTRTVVLGKSDKRTKEAIRLVRKAQRAALKTIKAGILAREADRAARKIIIDAGFGKCFGHGLGHGVGLAVHEPPSLNRMRRNKLQAGMVVTVEPGIYLPGWGGVRLENMVVVEEEGCTVLNQDKTFLDL
ncbi:MAG: Xaa-Pro peptidase family protein [Thermodesulfobacteriota bacterium]